MYVVNNKSQWLICNIAITLTNTLLFYMSLNATILYVEIQFSSQNLEVKLTWPDFGHMITCYMWSCSLNMHNVSLSQGLGLIEIRVIVMT